MSVKKIIKAANQLLMYAEGNDARGKRRIRKLRQAIDTYQAKPKKKKRCKCKWKPIAEPGQEGMFRTSCDGKWYNGIENLAPKLCWKCGKKVKVIE